MKNTVLCWRVYIGRNDGSYDSSDGNKNNDNSGGEMAPFFVIAWAVFTWDIRQKSAWTVSSVAFNLVLIVLLVFAVGQCEAAPSTVKGCAFILVIGTTEHKAAVKGSLMAIGQWYEASVF